MCEKADSAPIVLSGHGLPESMEGVETPLKAWKSNKTGNMLRVQEVQSSNPGGPINQFRPWFYCSTLSHRPVRGAGRPCEKCERIGQLGRGSHLWPTRLSRLTISIDDQRRPGGNPAGKLRGGCALAGCGLPGGGDRRKDCPRARIPKASRAGGANGWFPYRRRWLRKPPFIWRWENVGMTNLQLARELGCDEKEVWRMLNPRHPTKLPRIKDCLLYTS